MDPGIECPLPLVRAAAGVVSVRVWDLVLLSPGAGVPSSSCPFLTTRQRTSISSPKCGSHPMPSVSGAQKSSISLIVVATGGYRRLTNLKKTILPSQSEPTRTGGPHPTSS